MLGAASTLRDLGAALNDAQKNDLLATMIDESERLNRFIANLLDMTKLESGAIVPNTARHDVGEIVGSALRRAGKILVHHKVSLELGPNLPMLELDAVLFEQVLFNLLDNAAKYAPAGTTISITGVRAIASRSRCRSSTRARHSAGRTGKRVRQVLSRAERRPCSSRNRSWSGDLPRFCRGDARHDLGGQPRRSQRRGDNHSAAGAGATDSALDTAA